MIDGDDDSCIRWRVTDESSYIWTDFDDEQLAFSFAEREARQRNSTHYVFALVGRAEPSTVWSVRRVGYATEAQ